MRVLLLAVASVAACAPAAARAAWIRPVTLTARASTAVLPTVASDGRGYVVAAWYQIVGGGNVVMARTSANGGMTWSATQRLGAALIAQDGNRPAPLRAAVGAGGVAAIAWQQQAGRGQRIVAAVARRGARFGRARTVSAPGAGAFYPDVAVDRAGRVAVVWVTPTQVQRALVLPGGGIRRRVVANAPQSDLPAIAANPRGDLVFAWVEQTTTFPPRVPVFGSRESSSGRVVAPQQLAVDGADLPQVAMAANGRATVAWEESIGTAPAVIEAASAASGGMFGADQRLSDPGLNAILGGGAAGSRGLGVDGTGRVSAIWVEGQPDSLGGFGRVRVATSAPRGRFGAPRTLQTIGGNRIFERPAIGVAARGATIATWTAVVLAGTSHLWGSASRRSGGAFARPSRISGPFGDASAVAATSANGAGLAVWTEGQSGGPVRAARWQP